MPDATTRERGEERGVPVARHDLGRDRLRRQPHLRGDVLLDARVDIGERANRAGDLAGGDLGARGDEARPVAGELGVMTGELDAERGRLGMDAVAAPDADRVLVLARALFERRHHPVDVGDQDVRRPGELDGKAGIEHVRRGHALVHEARLRPDMLGEVGEEGDHVVMRLALDLVDAGDVEFSGRPRPHGLGGLLGDHAELGLGVGGVGLDFEPDAEAGLRLPQGHHVGTGIARDHAAIID